MAQIKGSNIIEEFEPFCKWTKEEHQDTVEIELPKDFKKENLKIRFISPLGQLTIEGKVDKPESKCFLNKPESKCFYKLISVPNNKFDDIHAKLSDGKLYITIKKNVCCTQQNQDINKDNKMPDCCRAIGRPEIATSGNVRVIRDYKSGIKLGGKKGWALVFLMFVVASGAYLAYKRDRPYLRVQDCPCMA